MCVVMFQNVCLYRRISPRIENAVFVTAINNEKVFFTKVNAALGQKQFERRGNARHVRDSQNNFKSQDRENFQKRDWEHRNPTAENSQCLKPRRRQVLPAREC